MKDNRELKLPLVFLLFLLLFTFILRNQISQEFFLFYLFYYQLSHLFILFFLFLAFYGTGRLILKQSKFPAFLEEIIISFSLGAGAWAIFVLLLGLLGVIRKEVYLLFLIPFSIYGLFLLVKNRKDFHFYPPLLVLSPFLYLAFLGIFTPPLSYDALAYHLAVPKFYIMQGKVTYLPYHLYSDFPFNMEMLYLLALRIFDDYIVKGLHLLMGVVLGMAVYSWARREGGKKGGLWAALLYFSIPLFLQLSTLAYNDLALALFVFLSFYALSTFSNRQGVILSGVFSGLAMGTKYTGILFTLPFLFLYILFFNNEEKGWKAALIYLFVSLLTFAPWMIKNIYFTGNPLFPLFYPLLGGKNFSLLLYQKFLSAHRASSASLAGFLSYTYRLLWDARFGFHFLLLIPLLFFPLAKKYKFVSLYCLYLLLILYFFTYRGTRFAFPLFPFLALLLGILLNRIKFTRLTLIFLQSVVIFSLSLNWFKDMVYFNYYDFGKVSLRLTNRDEYLREKLYFYPANEFINKNLPANSRILFVADNQTYYCDLPYISFSPLDKNPFADLIRESANTKEVKSKLKEWGVTHILFNRSEFKRVEESYRPFAWKEKDLEKFQSFLASCKKLYDQKGVSIYALP
ncbi:MAG: hypothetical protein GXO71_01450 [Caldiserica bacterium]|nr:hypothetical protein [Caldisericota bacterium]